MNEPSVRLAGARVIDPDGKAIGAVQKVEWRDGRPERLDIALLGGEKTVTLEAFTIRYDASTNVLTASQGARTSCWPAPRPETSPGWMHRSIAAPAGLGFALALDFHGLSGMVEPCP